MPNGPPRSLLARVMPMSQSNCARCIAGKASNRSRKTADSIITTNEFHSTFVRARVADQSRGFRHICFELFRARIAVQCAQETFVVRIALLVQIFGIVEIAARSG